ncbi:MAG TPA: hypothetical protein GXX49_10715 [Clostridiaceae bacterium]|nr:hypothetical protein [Clostridiaceae bacterium]
MKQILLAAIIIGLLLSGCTIDGKININLNNPGTATESGNISQNANEALFKLLPEKEGYTWIYNGFAEYGHQMTLEEIVTDNEKTTYIIKGKVFDMSDGESGMGEEHFSIDLKYIIQNGSIIQVKKENIMMDSEMDRLELIRAPLVEGNKWTQVAADKKGNERHLNSEITKVEELDGKKVYTVEYRDRDSDYYEIRTIEEGTGVVSFARLWNPDGEAFEIGYSLYREMSGYNKD